MKWEIDYSAEFECSDHDTWKAEYDGAVIEKFIAPVKKAGFHQRTAPYSNKAPNKSNFTVKPADDDKAGNEGWPDDSYKPSTEPWWDKSADTELEPADLRVREQCAQTLAADLMDNPSVNGDAERRYLEWCREQGIAPVLDKSAVNEDTVLVELMECMRPQCDHSWEGCEDIDPYSTQSCPECHSDDVQSTGRYTM